MSEKVSILIDEAAIEERMIQLGDQISRDYAGKEIHLIGVLKGSVFFLTELAKKISVPCTVDFMAVSSYGNNTVSSGRLVIKKELDEDIKGREVILVEDIVDSGNTLARLKPMLLERNPADLKICTLLDKPSRREADIQVDYTGFMVPDEFIVGYGLDYAQKYRNLPYIGVLSLE